MNNPKIMVIRRDNIGDLVCTTPSLVALRQSLPDAHIAVLANTYNCDVLDDHPAVDTIYAYEKGKHRGFGRSLVESYWHRWCLFREIRKKSYDYAILAGPGYQRHALQFAKMAGVAHVIGFVETGQQRGIDMAVPYGGGQELHEVEDVFRLLGPLGIKGPPPPMLVSAREDEIVKVRRAITNAKGSGPLVALHLSARKASQRWPSEKFIAVARVLAERYGARLLLLWSPGTASNPMHPGDDEKASSVAVRLNGIAHVAYPTHSIASLTAALAVCNIFIGADGGAMHLAAALGKPVVALFGDSSPARWRPWGVKSEVLQASSRQVADLSVAEVADAVGRLLHLQIT